MPDEPKITVYPARYAYGYKPNHWEKYKTDNSIGGMAPRPKARELKAIEIQD